MLGEIGKAPSAESGRLPLRKKSVACKRNERMQNERVEKNGDGARARSATENVNGCLRYSLCLKFMQNAYFGIPDTAGSVCARRVTVRASIYKLHKSSRPAPPTPPPSARPGIYIREISSRCFIRTRIRRRRATYAYSQEHNQHASSIEGTLHPLRGRGGEKGNGISTFELSDES